MPPVELPKAQSQSFHAVKHGEIILFAFDNDNSLLFWKGKPLAAESSGIVYHHQTEPSAAGTRAINAYAPDCPHMACDAKTFDFIVGSMLTRIALPLTTALKGGK